MSNLAARQAIETYLIAEPGGVAFVPGDNVGMETPLPVQIGYFMPARPDDEEIGSKMTRLNGLYQINLSYAAGEGSGDAEARGEVLRSYFKRGLTLTQSGVNVLITDTPQVGAGKQDDDRWVVPVTLRWQAWVPT